MSGRGTANLLTRTTAILGTAFFVLSLALALLGRGTGLRGSILDVAPPPAATAPAPALPAAPAAPSASQAWAWSPAWLIARATARAAGRAVTGDEASL